MEKNIEELLEIEKEKKTFEILKREQAITREQRSKRNSAILAGLFAVGMIAASVTQNLTMDEISQIHQHELEALTSWDSLKQYFCDLGPAITATTAGLCASLVSVFKHNKKEQQNLEELSVLKNTKEDNMELINSYDKRRGNTNSR